MKSMKSLKSMKSTFLGNILLSFRVLNNFQSSFKRVYPRVSKDDENVSFLSKGGILIRKSNFSITNQKKLQNKFLSPYAIWIIKFSFQQIVSKKIWPFRGTVCYRQQPSAFNPYFATMNLKYTPPRKRNPVYLIALYKSNVWHHWNFSKFKRFLTKHWRDHFDTSWVLIDRIRIV